MKTPAICLTALLFAATASCRDAPAAKADAPSRKERPAAAPTEIPLWPAGLAIAKPELDDAETRGQTGGAGTSPVAGKPWTYVANTWRPTMTIYPPKGENTHAALMVYPGGGYKVLAIDLEGTEICDWATRIGMTCVVVKYRVPQSWWHEDCGCQYPPRPFMPLEDAQRAMGLLRQRAASLGVDPHKIGVIGFSAGGHLVTAISNASGRSYKPVDAADRLSARPDFAMPLYPGHLWSGDDHAAAAKGKVALYPFDPVVADGPPTFMVQAEDDPVDDVRHSIAYFLALSAKKVPVEMHIYAHGGHAFGARPTGQPITRWPELAETWLHTIGILGGGSLAHASPAVPKPGVAR